MVAEDDAVVARPAVVPGSLAARQHVTHQVAELAQPHESAAGVLDRAVHHLGRRVAEHDPHGDVAHLTAAATLARQSRRRRALACRLRVDLRKIDDASTLTPLWRCAPPPLPDVPAFEKAGCRLGAMMGGARMPSVRPQPRSPSSRCSASSAALRAGPAAGCVASHTAHQSGWTARRSCLAAVQSPSNFGQSVSAWAKSASLRRALPAKRV